MDLKTIDSPLGPLNVVATADGICRIDFADSSAAVKWLEAFAKMPDASFDVHNNAGINRLEIQLREYFEGKRKHFTVKLSVSGTPFQKKVWETLQKISYGTTCSYKEQSIAAGAPKAVRAVARANAANPLPIVVPCHRVIGANGHLTGYAGGLWRKELLLKIEMN
jgi:AraC family transcriptional regulator of adaptative response/methylated-DNA-[protein]-cysteine methyltransferase